MATKHLKLRPHHIDENSWWYEEPEGITVVHNSTSGSVVSIIPWRQIRAALKRLDKK